jgi:hypothetical protein
VVHEDHNGQRRAGRVVERLDEDGAPWSRSTTAARASSNLDRTPYGLTLMLEDAGLEVLEVRPVIDASTLIAWRALGMPRFIFRWWARESPPYRAISALSRPARWDHRTVNTAKLVLTGQFTFLARRSS